MGILLAVLSAVLYGSGDFLGGLSSRRESALAVTWYSQMAGLGSIVVVAVVVGADRVTSADWGGGAMGGLAGAAGLLLLYGALAKGPMAVVAPVTALLSAVVPAIAGFVQGERPSAYAVVGVLLALPAIGLAASAGDLDLGSVHARILAESIVAGSMFGLFFVFFAQAGDEAGMWPTVAAKVASVTALSLVVAVPSLRQNVSPDGSMRVARASLPLIVGAGLFDVGANALYLAATREGLLALISVITAMYPAATVLLAATVLREPIRRPQMIGLVLAAIAIGLVAAAG